MTEPSDTLKPTPDFLSLRASDAEREQVVEHLTTACAEGRLTLEELGVRVASAYGAVSRAELTPLVADLPDHGSTGIAPAASAPPKERPRHRRGRWIVSIMGETERTGRWRLPVTSRVLTMMGETRLDLRDALIEAPEIEMTLFVLMGETRVLVPDGVDVEVSGVVVMGEKRVEATRVPPRPGVPRLHLKVRGMMAEVRVETTSSPSLEAG